MIHIPGAAVLFASIFIVSLPLRGQESSVGKHPADGDRVISLAECLDIALRNNSSLKRGALARRRGQIEYSQARLNQLPALSASVGHGFNQGRSVDPTTNQFTERTFSSGSQGISADMSLFNGFRALHDIRMRAHAQEAGRLEYEGQVNALKLDVIEAYIQVLTATDMLQQSLNQQDVTREQLRRAEVMHRSGAFAPGDYHDIRGQIKSEENQVENVRRGLYTARLRLARLLQVDEQAMGSLAPLKARPQDQDQGLGWVLGPDGAGTLFERAQREWHPIRALDQQISAARQQIGVARSAFFPSLGVGAGLNSRFSNQYDGSYLTQMNQNLGKYVSFSLRIPIFSRLQTWNQVRQARLSYEDAQLQKELQLQLLKEETAKLVFDLRTSATAVRNLEEQVMHYAESFRIATVQFEAGASHSLSFLTAKNKVDAARQQLLVRQYEHLLQQYINDYYRGELGF